MRGKLLLAWSDSASSEQSSPTAVSRWVSAWGSILLLASLAAPVAAEKRVALVIGNGGYVNAAPLTNPANDAAAIANKLREAGFDIVEKTDLDAQAMRKALRDFSEQVRNSDIAVVFYAGHGMEMNGVNYMIPVDATIASDVDVEDEAIALERIVRILEPARRLQLVILDSCRDNPFLRSMRRTLARTRSLGGGHADIDEQGLPPNALIAYAQRAGATADDGSGTNSPYTAALLKHLTTPGLDVEMALRRVRDEVLQSTNNKQEPFKYGSLGGAELPLVRARATVGIDPSATPAASPIASPESWADIRVIVVQGLGHAAIISRRGAETWEWEENNARFPFRTISDGGTELVIYDEHRDIYHRMNLRSRQTFWRIGYKGEWKPHYALISASR